MSFAAMMLVAIGCDLAFGWPRWLFARIGHPVTWLGALISGLDRVWNPPDAASRMRGVAAALLVIALAALTGALLQAALPSGWAGILIGGVLAWPLVATRSMYEHVVAVARPLEAGDLARARCAVAMIVGRDPVYLDAAGVARATLESLAENASDGVVAPLFWGALAGLPGIAAYKAINTLDSMIGHRTPRHEKFGWAAARIDDFANLIPARLTGILFALVSARPAEAIACMRRDARHHRSPNAGWPEAAMAGALGVRVSGPRVYADRAAEEPYVNATARDPVPSDIRRGLWIYMRATLALGILLAGLFWI